MARIKLKIGENEIEVDSRDFYVDNSTLNDVINNLIQYLPENHSTPTHDYKSTNASVNNSSKVEYALDYLDDAEAYEPEFNEPKHIPINEIKSKLQILKTSKFFDSPKTVTETVQQLREFGWATSPLDVSKTLAKMASSKEILKSSDENMTHYFLKNALVVNS